MRRSRFRFASAVAADRPRPPSRRDRRRLRRARARRALRSRIPVPSQPSPSAPPSASAAERAADRRLFVTTLTELNAIAALARIGREQQAEGRVQHARRDRDADHVVDERPEQVLLHRPHRAARQRDRVRDRAQVAAHERHVRRLDGDVGARADRDADVGLRERRRVVDAVARPSRPPSPRAWSRSISATLPSGSTPATTRSMPASRATASAVARASPVSITTSSPMRRSRAIASREVGRIGSATARTAASAPSTATKTAVARRAPRAPAAAPASGTGRDARARRGAPGCRRATRCPSTTPRAPRPVTDSNVGPPASEPGALRGRVRHDGVGERVLARALDGGGEREQRVPPRAARRARGRRRSRPAAPR